MRPSFSFRLSHPDVRAVRTALTAGAVAGLVVIAACTEGPSRSITAPRTAVIGSGGFGQAKLLTLCVDANAPAGTYTFKNDELNRSFAQDSWNNALSGNGFFDGTFWNDPGDGGNGTTVQNALEDVNYTLSPGGCVNVLTRTSGDVAFMAKLPIADGGSCDPNTQSCGGVADSFAAANILFLSASNGYLYDHTDCLVDNGDLMPEHINPTTGNPPVAIVPWPTGGFDGSAAFTNYGCGTSNNPTRGFTNFEHGVKLTFFFHAPPPQEVIPLFVIGDIEPHGIGANVNFWGSQWWKNNPMSLFHSDGWPSFKGYASSVDLTPSNGNPCGTWTSRVGNSPPPPQTIPEFVGIIVTNNVVKSGPDLVGGIQQIIIVHQDGGYGPAPGHDGNGTVTSIVCPAP